MTRVTLHAAHDVWLRFIAAEYALCALLAKMLRAPKEIDFAECCNWLLPVSKQHVLSYFSDIIDVECK